MDEDDLLDPYQQNRTRKPDEIEKVLSQQIYVDDLIASRPSLKEAVQLIDEAIGRFRRYQLEFCKVSSNSAMIRREYPNQAKISPIKSLAPVEQAPSDPTKGQSLGLQWDMEKDMFSIKTEHTKRPRTKRGLLGQIGEPYDPFGIAQPAMLVCRLLQREIFPRPEDPDPHGCRALGWDDPDRPWNKMEQTCQEIQSLAVERSFYPKNCGRPDQQQLFAFADASDLAVCYVIYLRTKTTEGSVHIAFVCGKTKVLPKGTSVKGQLSIPRAELCAADELAKQVFAIEHQLDIPTLQPTQYFTDSRDVLGWITNTT